MPGAPDSELDWIRHESPLDLPPESLAVHWDRLPDSARVEVLDQSGVLDIAAETYLDLADGFEAFVSLPWSSLPPEMRDVMSRRVKVFVRGRAFAVRREVDLT